MAWLSVWSEMQTCIWLLSWCHCHSLSLAPVKSRLVLPFWYRLTRVVPEKGPLNGCVCVSISEKGDKFGCFQTFELPDLLTLVFCMYTSHDHTSLVLKVEVRGWDGNTVGLPTIKGPFVVLVSSNSVYITQGCERVDHQLNCLQKNGRHKKRFEFMSLISKDVVGHGGTVPSHPLGF